MRVRLWCIHWLLTRASSMLVTLFKRNYDTVELYEMVETVLREVEDWQRVERRPRR